MKLSASTSLAIAAIIHSCVAFAPSGVSTLLQDNAAKISQLKEIASQYPAAPTDSIFYLRYCLSDKEDSEIQAQLKSNLEWRANEGKVICESASAAIKAATSAGKWDNTPVRDMAPHGSAVNKYITPSQSLTTLLNSGDLCYCIRAGFIDDVALMSEVSVEQMTDFFLYCKEVNALVANMRSEDSDQLIQVLTANDLTGVKLIGGDKTFRKALGAASTKANALYPNLSGPTFLLNLPTLLNALVKLFTPLFPEDVRKRLKFAKGPLKNVSDMSEISPSGDAASRALFLKQIDDLLA
mmetsp:Transcript_17244/g.22437  ORF Transcript_17244/g.22437 Transcript_17244/m.22437 type:complete len:296 (+) Transcript_17244:88-975(+)|eukprot:CAMPEP_0198143472 /NCGR_PEP_ID=MMETSP1443-20131203/7777_1 /TAXON_ID=186043 /ORGANISM="Entomoneis sp., Strain CCMP2396" /LENGTH=295 /DNA_ID=CAMNT_0043806713 /DNA_START=80 /DNA_END=967 /DNA_ORIENTATION=+